MNPGDGVRIELAPSATKDVRALVDELEAVLAAEIRRSSGMAWRSMHCFSRTSASSSHGCMVRRWAAAAWRCSMILPRSSGCMCGMPHGDRA